jgi:hypothetical protein
MPKTVSIILPHNLPQAEVRVRIDSALAEMRRVYPAYAGTLQETWAGDRMDFSLSAMGQAVTGRIDVLPATLKVEIDLPMFLAMLADAIRNRVETEGRKLLSGPKSSGK